MHTYPSVWVSLPGYAQGKRMCESVEFFSMPFRVHIFFLAFVLSHLLCCASTHTHTCTLSLSHTHAGTCLILCCCFCARLFFYASHTKQKQQDGLICRWRQNSNDTKLPRWHLQRQSICTLSQRHTSNKQQLEKGQVLHCTMFYV